MDTTSSFISAATNGALTRIPSLQSTNYRQWSFAMKFLLDGEDLWELVHPESTDIEPQNSRTGARTRTQGTCSPTPTSDSDKRKCKKAAYLIYQSCTSLPQSYIAHEKNPAKMWSILKDLYSRIDDDEAGQALFEEFWLEQFQKYKSIEEYGAKLKNYQDQLANITERRLTDSNLILQLVRGLPPQYDDVVMMIRINKSKMTFHQALKVLIERERILSDRRQSEALIVGTSTSTSTSTNTSTSNSNSNSTDINAGNRPSNSASNSAENMTGNNRNSNHRSRRQHQRQQWRNDHRGKPYHRESRNSPLHTEYDFCTYCGLTEHMEEACFIRRRAERRIAEKEASPSTAAAYTAFTTTSIADSFPRDPL